MKKTIPLCVLLVPFIIASTSSCNKGDEPTPKIVDSIKSLLPKQIIWNLGEADSVIISLKYDTANHKVELYEDNPATPDFYDKLVFSSTFNNDGYLVNYMINTDKFDLSSFDNAVININRASDNKINYIAYEDKDNNRKDTSFYTYQSVNGGTKITTVGDQNYFEGTPTEYNYDRDNKLIFITDTISYDTMRLFYNPNNSISKITKSDNVSEFLYSSGIPDDKEDMVGRIILGKDYYLWDITDLNPFVYSLDHDYDDYRFSITNQNHFTRMVDTHDLGYDDTTGIEGLRISYELNENKLLSKITLKYDGGSSDAVTIFKY